MLERLTRIPGSRHRPKRVGRGPGSGIGRYCGRGIKGQGTRSRGRPVKLRFEGGQMPLTQRLPKRGFRSRSRRRVEIVNLSDLTRFEAGATIDGEALVAKGLIKKATAWVKILGEGDAPEKLSLKVNRISAGARQKVEAAGGSVELLS
jgi:large subunit ribosomal protein L15